jgi:hypothetical protein
MLFNFIQINRINISKLKFISIFEKFKSNKLVEQKNSSTILVQLIEDFDFCLRMAAASKIFSEKKDLNVISYDPYIYKFIGRINYKYFFNSLNFETLLQKIYKKFSGKIIHNNDELYFDQKFIENQTNIIYNSLFSIDDIFNITIEDINIGDLIYDTYLRYYHKPTIECLDDNVKKLISVSLNIYYTFKPKIEKYKIEILIQPYTAYITNGIIARICLKSNVDVYTIGSDAYIIQKITSTYPFHSINHTNFSPDIIIKNDNFLLAKNSLEKRFVGEIDHASSYMRSSSFFDSKEFDNIKEKFNKQKKNIVFYIHEFYDSPHINRKLLFRDLYQFFYETMKILSSLEHTNIFIKLHPNAIEGNLENVLKVYNKYKNENFYILNNDVSNKDIIKLKPDLILTARGTVGIEMSYFKIPVIAIYDNMYCNFNFAHTCHTKDEFFNIIKGEIKPQPVFDNNNIISFYYQAYLEKIENDKFDILKKIKISNFGNFSNEYIYHFIKNINNVDIENLLILYDKEVNKFITS